MYLGRTSVDSHGAVASPAMTVWSKGATQTLVLVWCGSDGTIYFASGMEQAGALNAVPLSNTTSLERPALVQFEDRLVLGYTGTDNQMWSAISYDGQSFMAPQLWEYIDGTTIAPMIGGPALFQLGPNMLIAGTQQLSQIINFGWGVNPPELYQYSSLDSLTSIDTLALGAAPSGLQLAFAGANDPANNLSIQPDPRSSNLAPVVVYADQCYGSPALVTTTSGYAAAFVNKLYNIVLLYGIENLDPQNVNRVVLQDSSWHAPAVATINGVTYVAWIGTDQPGNPGLPTGRLNFADLGSMPQVTCALSTMMAKPAADQLRNLRDQELLKSSVGRMLAMELDQHSAELLRLEQAHPELGRQVQALLQRVEPIATSGSKFDDATIQDSRTLLYRFRAVASAQLRASINYVMQLTSCFRGSTLVDGLAKAERVIK